MKELFLALGVAIVVVGSASAQQPLQRPNAQQITQQILENEVNAYRGQIGQLIEQVNKLTDENNDLKKQLSDKPAAEK